MQMFGIEHAELKFCSNYGTAMRIEIQCHNCGITLLANSSFCSECGNRLKSQNNRHRTL